MVDRELTGSEAQQALSEAVRRTLATKPGLASALVPAETGTSQRYLRLAQMSGYLNGYDATTEADQHHAYAVGFSDAVRAALSSSPVQPEPDPCDACGTETGVTGVTYCAVCAAIRQPDPVTPSSVASGAGADGSER